MINNQFYNQLQTVRNASKQNRNNFFKESEIAAKKLLNKQMKAAQNALAHEMETLITQFDETTSKLAQIYSK